MFIYKITNKVNGKVYVGKTEKPKAEQRWNQHRNELKGNRHINKHFQASWNKYGEENFVFEVIEEFNPEMNFDLNNLEKFWIKELDSTNPEKGYNKTLGGDGCFQTEEIRKKMSDNHWSKKSGYINPTKGKKLSPDHVLKLKESHKGHVGDKNGFFGKKHSLEFRLKRKMERLNNQSPRSKKVFCYNNGKVYSSQKEAALELGCHRESVSKVCRGLLDNIKGFKFKYANEVLSV